MVLTFRREAVLGSMTLRMSLTSCETDEPTWPCFIIKDLGTLDVDLSCVAAVLRCVLVFLRFLAMDEKVTVGGLFLDP